MIVNAYSSTLISYLTATKLPAAKTFEELAARSPQDWSNYRQKHAILGTILGIYYVLKSLFLKHCLCLPTGMYEG